MPKPKILVIGSINTDLVVTVPRAPAAGETIMGAGFKQFSGGKRANQAVAAARMGAETIMSGRVGNDAFGREQIAALQREGIDTGYIKTSEEQPTGVALITVDEAGNNRIVVIPGANGECTREDIDPATDGIRRADLLVFQLEIPPDVVEYAINKAYSLGTAVILNPAPAAALNRNIYSRIKVITPNETEAGHLTGIDVDDVDDSEAIKRAARVFRQWGTEQVLITLGSRGVYGLSNEEEFHLPAFPVNAVDTVAAGDSFTGALAVCIAEGATLEEAARFAAAVAAISVTRQGAQQSIPVRDEVLDFLQRHPEN